MAKSLSSVLLLLLLWALLLAVNVVQAQPAQYKRSFTNPLMKETFYVLEECQDTRNASTYLEVVIPADAAAPLHHHDKYDEYMEVIQGVFHTTIGGVNKSYLPGETFVFPIDVTHTWWTSTEQGATVRIKISEPSCFDGFHESVEVYSNLPKDMLDEQTLMVKDPWITASLYGMGGTIIHGEKWYENIIFWVFKMMAKLEKTQKLKQELREKYIGVGGFPPTEEAASEPEGDDDESCSSRIDSS